MNSPFNKVAEEYDRARPGYPEQLFEDLICLSGIPNEGRILEVGCGTGQATLPLARRKYRIQCIDPAERMVLIARRKLAAFEAVSFCVSRFEEWPVEFGAFDVVFSASAFHWIDEEIGYVKASKALKRLGSLALVWNLFVQTEESSAFVRSLREVYMREAPDLHAFECRTENPNRQRPRLDIKKREILQTGLFDSVDSRRYSWGATYDRRTYVELVHTYYSAEVLPEVTRNRLFAAIGDLIDREFGGHVRRDYLSALYLARKRQ